MNYRVRRQIDDQLEYFGQRVITRGHVLEDPPFPNLRTLIEAGFLAPVDEPATLFLADDETEPEEILADLEPYIELNTPAARGEDLDGGSDEAAPVEYSCRHDGCDSDATWETRRARTAHEVRAHGSPGEGE